MEKNEIIVQEQLFEELMKDALIILEEIKELQSYLKLEDKKSTITEYQIFKTLYLKRKVNSCLEKLESIATNGELECTDSLRKSTLAQFESLKQVIEAVDIVNRSKKITKFYTKEEMKYIKEYEDNKENNMPQLKWYVIPTRLTFTYKIEIQKTAIDTPEQDKADKEVVIVIGSLLFITSMLIFDAIYFHTSGQELIPMSILIVVMGIYLKVKGYFLKENYLRILVNIFHVNRYQIEETLGSIGIRNLKSVSRTYFEIINYRKIDLQDKNEIKVLNECLIKASKGFEVYDDYETYVDILLLLERINPILFEERLASGDIEENKVPEHNETKESVLHRGNDKGKINPLIFGEEMVYPRNIEKSKTTEYSKTKEVVSHKHKSKGKSNSKKGKGKNKKQKGNR